MRYRFLVLLPLLTAWGAHLGDAQTRQGRAGQPDSLSVPSKPVGATATLDQGQASAPAKPDSVGGGEGKGSPDHRTGELFWTIRLSDLIVGLATAALAIVAIFQYKAMVRQEAWTKKSVDVMGAQEKDMDRQGLLMASQLSSMQAQEVDLRASVEVARAAADAARASADAAVAAERAYLFFDIKASSLANGSNGALVGGQIVGVVLSNYGRTPGILRWAEATFEYSATQPTQPIADAVHSADASTVISAGQSVTCASAILSATPHQLAEAARKNGGLYLSARVEYADVFDRTHSTAVCWQYDFRTSGFSQVTNARVTFHT